MNIADALYNAVHDYPGGVASMAPRMKLSDSSLTKKVNPNYPQAHCSPEEQARICELSGDRGPLIAFAERLNCLVLHMPELGESDVDAKLAQQMALTVKEFGDFMVESGQNLADNRCTATELRRIQREGLQAIAAIQRLCALAASMHQDCAPKGVLP